MIYIVKNMANIRKMMYPRDVLIKLESEEYKKFVENLPRTKSFSDAIREYIKSCNEELEKKKNLNSPNYSAVKETNNDDIYHKYISNNNNATLDIYLLLNDDIRETIWKIQDVETLAKIEKKGFIVNTVAKTRKRELLPIEKLKNEMMNK